MSVVHVYVLPDQTAGVVYYLFTSERSPQYTHSELRENKNAK